MTKIKCIKCGEIFEIPKGNCTICFGDELGELADIKDEDKRHEELTVFINNLTSFDYDRGFHNAKCINQLESDCLIIGNEFEEID